jgi:RHS repeat-associated protein
MDRVATRTDPLTRSESFSYDTNGNLTGHTNRRSQAASFTYDALDRRTGATHVDATVTYTYDAGNRVTQVVDSVGGTVSNAYDGLDRVTSETTSLGTVTYTYDAAGRRATMAVPSQTSISYGYDNADRLTSITQGTAVVQYAYDNANRRSTLTLPNGVVTEYGYDAASQLTGLTYKLGGATLGGLTYTYDPAGRRGVIDGTWARTGLPAAVNSATYNANNQQTAFGGATLTYDLTGNLTGDGTNTYTWDSRNRLTAVSGPTAASFVYDALGRRRSKTFAGTTTSVLHDGLNPAQEQTGSATVNLLTGLGIDEFVSRTDTNGTMSLVADALGSTVALTDTAGAVQTSYTYEPFGVTGSTGAATPNVLDYTGREGDPTGLKYYRARYYHPALHRFISEDPIGFRGSGVNLYQYVRNNPVNLVDPLGLVDSISSGSVSVGYSKTLGTYVSVKSPFGTVTHQYGHMDPATIPRNGTYVNSGTYIGEYADPTNGRSTGPHVHVQKVGPLKIIDPLDTNSRFMDPGDSSPIPGGCKTSGFRKMRFGVPHSGVDYQKPEDCNKKPGTGGDESDDAGGGSETLSGRKD